jgi:hypothetical protein
MKAISEELRGLACEKDVAIVSATQTNRSGFENSDPGLEDISDSFGIAFVADFVYALYASDELKERDLVVVSQLKNRFGDPTRHKRFMLGFDRPKMNFYDVDENDADNVKQIVNVVKTEEKKKLKF